MQRITSTLYLMHADPALRSLLARMPGQQPTIIPVGDWETLRDLVRKAPPSAVFLVDAFGPYGGLSEELRDALRSFPSALLVAALPETVENADVLRTLVSWGVADTLDTGRERTLAAVARRISLVRSRAVHRLLRRALPRGIPSRTRGLLTVAAEVAAAGGHAADFAAALGVAERTVPRWCARADLPAPRRLLAWLRILMAADLLDDPGRSIESVARACGYSAASSLKPALRNLLGLSPADLRARGAFDTAADAFTAELGQLREAARVESKSPKDWLH